MACAISCAVRTVTNTLRQWFYGNSHEKVKQACWAADLVINEARAMKEDIAHLQTSHDPLLDLVNNMLVAKRVAERQRDGHIKTLPIH